MPFTSELAREVAPGVLERFLRYVRIDTQSAYGSGTYPSTAKQLDLSRLLVEELRGLGLADAHLDAHGYALATLPATVERPAPVIGLLAHVDTTPDVPGTEVRAQVIRDYGGGEILLPGDPSQALRPSELPELRAHVGHDLVTSDGTTVLGADPKAGVAEIMAALAYLSRHPELAHGPVRIAFTPDEEIGEGTRHFDLTAFGAEAAYTVDGETAGEIQDETFSALEAFVTIRGVEAHPGFARGKFVNSIRLAAALVARLPAELAPETTEGREGFVHPDRIDGTPGETVLRIRLRDFDEGRLAGHEALLRRLAADLVAAEPRAEARVEVRRQYRNMREYLAAHPRVVEAAEIAMRRAGLEPRRTFIRGGTDGARLSELGLPTPNLFTGGHEYHSRREWVCVQDMADAVATLVHLVQVWAEPA